MNLSEDPHLCSTVLYQIPEGTTWIGSSPPKGDKKTAVRRIVLSGLGIEPLMLRIERSGAGLVAIPVPPAQSGRPARVLVNGLRLREQQPLSNGDRLLFGFVGGFRVQFPGAAPAVSSLQEALEEIADDSEVFQGVSRVANFIQESLGDLRAAAFLRKIHKVCAHVDEANKATAFVRPSSGSFEVEVMLDMAELEHRDPTIMVAKVPPRRLKQMTQKVMRSTGIAGAANMLKRQQSLSDNKEDSTDKVLWSYDVFLERLVHMRDVYAKFHAASLEERKRILANMRADPSTDPWVAPEKKDSSPSSERRTDEGTVPLPGWQMLQGGTGPFSFQENEPKRPSHVAPDESAERHWPAESAW